MNDNMGKFPGLDKDKPTMITKFIANGRSIKQPEIIQVTSGLYHNVLLDKDGRIYTFGGGLIPNANGGPRGYDKPTRVEGVLGDKYIVQISMVSYIQ